MKKNILKRVADKNGWAFTECSRDYSYAFKLLSNGDIIRAVSVEINDKVEIRLYDEERRIFRKEEDFQFPYATISITNCYIGYVIPDTVSELVARETKRLTKFIKDNQEEILGITRFEVIDTKPIRKEKVRIKEKIKSVNVTTDAANVENDINKPTTFEKISKGLKEMAPLILGFTVAALTIYQRKEDKNNKK